MLLAISNTRIDGPSRYPRVLQDIPGSFKISQGPSRYPRVLQISQGPSRYPGIL